MMSKFLSRNTMSCWFDDFNHIDFNQLKSAKVTVGNILEISYELTEFHSNVRIILPKHSL